MVVIMVAAPTAENRLATFQGPYLAILGRILRCELPT